MYGRVVCDRTPEAPAKNLAKYSRNSHVTFSRPPPFNDEGRWSRRMRRWCKWRDLETKYNKKKNRKIPPVPASLPPPPPHDILSLFALLFNDNSQKYQTYCKSGAIDRVTKGGKRRKSKIYTQVISLSRFFAAAR